jgi:hypothetical protein
MHREHINIYDISYIVIDTLGSLVGIVDAVSDGSLVGIVDAVSNGSLIGIVDAV